jgi:hypothetical protein
MSATANSTTDSRLRNVLMSYFPMFIATLSLLTSIYNGYLNSKFVDLIQRNVGRVEYMKTCKEIIDAYFQVKLRVGLVNAAGERTGAAAARAEAANAVAKFAALGTYLANLRDEAIRVRYTELSTRLQAIADEAGRLSPAEIERRYEVTDRLFAEMNDDCIGAAKQ